MLVLLFTLIYLISHIGVYYLLTKLNFEDGPDTVIYTISYYVTQIVSPFFILIGVILIFGYAREYDLTYMVKSSLFFLGITLFASCTIMMAGKIESKTNKTKF